MGIDNPRPGIKSVHGDHQDPSHQAQRAQDHPGSAETTEQVVIESRAPSEPTSTEPESGPPRAEYPNRQAPVIRSPPEWTIVPDGRVTLSGTSEPSSRIVIQDWLTPAGSCTADENGHWTITIEHLTGGAHLFVAAWVDHHGGTVAASYPWTIQVPYRPDADARQENTGPLGIRRLLRRPRRTDTAPGSTPITRPQPDDNSGMPMAGVHAESAPADFPATGPPAMDTHTDEAVSVPPAVVHTDEASAPEEQDDTDHPETYPSHLNDSQIPSIVHPESGSKAGQTLTLYGTSAANSTIHVLDGMTPVAAVECDDTGYWTATLKALTPGTHQLQARSLTNNSTPPRTSPPVTVHVSDASLAGTDPEPAGH